MSSTSTNEGSEATKVNLGIEPTPGSNVHSPTTPMETGTSSHRFTVHPPSQKVVRSHRKRKREANAVAPSSPPLSNSSSSSSSDEDEECKTGPLDGVAAVSISFVGGRDPSSAGHRPPSQQQQQLLREKDHKNALQTHGLQDVAEPQGSSSRDMEQEEQKQQQYNQQPDGWRVKLYRLNADGSWDDCGTGRILCLYKQQMQKGHDPTITATNPLANNNSLAGDGWIYQELGEPTLCMHSEVTTTHVGMESPRILLRTRILLRDAYQRQGENIITWCEPYLEEGNIAQGVDLALSFQDNSGCLDIWRQITRVQLRAAELLRLNGVVGDGSQVAGTLHVPNDTPEGVSSENFDAPNNHANATLGSVADVAQAVAAAHHASLQQRQQEMWVNVTSEASQHHLDHQVTGTLTDRNHKQRHFEETLGGMINICPDPNSHTSPNSPANNPQPPHLPNPPTLANLEEIADTIAAVQNIQQREALAMYISQTDCSYLKSLLSLFPSAESRGDYGSLATLAACVKTVLLFNDPSIIELIVTDESIFEKVCSTLEYDPDLRDKANHRWFLRERARFRTVALIEDESLVSAIHRSFRVNYLRDTLLRPTMDESSLSTLSSLQTFTHSEVVKGVTMSSLAAGAKGGVLKNSYLSTVIRILGRELKAICNIEWKELKSLRSEMDVKSLLRQPLDEVSKDSSTIVSDGRRFQSQKGCTTWRQHLAPQDISLNSRRVRRRGCLSFLRELFNMVRTSLQQSDKDNFFSVLVSMKVDLSCDEMPSDWSSCRGDTTVDKSDVVGAMVMNVGTKSEEEIKRRDEGSLKDEFGELWTSSRPDFLSLLSTVLSDPNTDVSEKGAVLEILGAIAMHDPSLIRRRCLEYYTCWKRSGGTSRGDNSGAIGLGRARPSEDKMLVFYCPPDDLLASLLCLLAVEKDAGVLLQTSEIMRIILDTDMLGDHGPVGAAFADEAEGIPTGAGHTLTHDQSFSSASAVSSTDQNQFLSLFYDHYVNWLVAPFQYTILRPVRRLPESVLRAEPKDAAEPSMYPTTGNGPKSNHPFLSPVPLCAIRSSFVVELLSFCVRAHLYRMKCFLVRYGACRTVLSLLEPPPFLPARSGHRCLKLASLRFLRAILSVNDEIYHRHIIQHNLFAPVFEAFRANPVGDNLVSSAIVEMCDYIHTENIRPLIKYIVTKHLTVKSSEGALPTLEDVSSPYVNTLTILRAAYEHNEKVSDNVQGGKAGNHVLSDMADMHHQGNGRDNSETHSPHMLLNERAREDQRKFEALDNDQSYFEADDDGDESRPSTVVPPAVDEVAAEEVETDLHRTPRMFSLSQVQLLKSGAIRSHDGDPAQNPRQMAIEARKHTPPQKK